MVERRFLWIPGGPDQLQFQHVPEEKHHKSEFVIVLLQRVASSRVVVGGDEIASIGPGLLVLVAVESGDTEAVAKKLLQKISRYRVFSDDNGKMNLSLLDTGGELLLVPQFTLAADTGRGLRPSFSKGASPSDGARLFDPLVGLAEALQCRVATGRFGADMQVELVNDGPVTFWLQESAT